MHAVERKREMATSQVKAMEVDDVHNAFWQEGQCGSWTYEGGMDHGAGGRTRCLPTQFGRTRASSPRGIARAKDQRRGARSGGRQPGACTRGRLGTAWSRRGSYSMVAKIKVEQTNSVESYSGCLGAWSGALARLAITDGCAHSPPSLRVRGSAGAQRWSRRSRTTTRAAMN